LSRPAWFFEYRPIRTPHCARHELDVIVATRAAIDPRALSVEAGMEVAVALDRAPLHWYRARRSSQRWPICRSGT